MTNTTEAPAAITEEQLLPLLQRVVDEDGLDINDGDIRDGHHRIEWYAWIAREAYALGARRAGATATVRTWRVEYNATADGSFSEAFVQADERDRIYIDDQSWTVFRHNDRIVTEIPDRAISLIEEMPSLTLSEREELEALRETVEIMSDPDTMADLAEADDEAEQTDWSAYRPCGTCLQETGEPCRFVRFEGGVGEARINPHLNRERIPAATA